MLFKIKPYKLLIFIILVYNTTVLADGITISQSVDKTETAFEDSVLFELSLTWQGNPIAYRFPMPLAPYFEKFKVHGFTSSINSFQDEGIEYTKKTYKFTLIPKSTGRANISPITVNYFKMPDSVEGELVSESFYVTIANPIPKKETEELPYFWYSLVALVLIGAGVYVWFLKFDKKRNDHSSKKSSDQDMIEKLDILYKENGSDIKSFQTGFYRLMSIYLEENYHIDIKGLSNEELFELLNRSDLTTAQSERIHKWLTQAEEDKYSPVSAQPGEVVRLVTEIKQFFENKMKIK